ncbi:MAG: 50S ribosomal protein L15 [Verrucomicrobiae bacterium]|nr:50S ribosomal protein L15 [Verrucomicrobiae bacterium]MDW8344554.1 50S ribosomal protein L15 [Verrucomicrobiae bacterium]
MRLHNLKPRPGAKHRRKRLGCGESSGHGKTSGRGGKGQTARSGGTIRLGFEGGQMPLLRRIPKRGFNNRAFRTEFAVVNVEDLNEFPDGAVVTPQELLAARLISKLEDGVKILGDGELTRRLTVQAQRFSRSAREKIAKAGGQCVELPLPGIRSKRATGAVSGATS